VNNGFHLVTEDTAIMLVSLNPAHAPELHNRSEIRRMMKVWGVKF